MRSVREVVLPLTDAQSGIWFAQMLQPDNPTYNLGEYLEIDGPLDLTVLESALHLVIQEAESLRARFITDAEGNPGQVIDSAADAPLLVIDVTQQLDPRSAAEAWMRADAEKPRDLARGPLYTLALFNVAENRFFLYLGYHHIVVDGTSMCLVVRRLADIYTTIVGRQRAHGGSFRSLRLLLEETAAYRTSRQFELDRTYWLGRLADLPSVVTLAGATAPMSRTVLRSTTHVSIGADLCDAAHRVGTKWPHVLIAAVAAYVHRMTGEKSLTLGLPVTSRRDLDATARYVPGMVSNVLPLRLTVGPRMTLRELTLQVANVTSEALAHQQFRYEDMRQASRSYTADRALVGPMVNVMRFDYNVMFAGNRISVHNVAVGPAEDVNVVAYDRRDGRDLRIDWDANPTLYGAEGVDGHVRRFGRFVRHLIGEGGNGTVGEVPLLDAAERHLITVGWNATVRRMESTTLTRLFDAQVARTPDKTAVVFERTSLSYSQVHSQTNRMAARLRELGVGPETLVAICANRTIDLVVGLLAILKAGGAYVPLDPEYPEARLEFMLSDANPAVLLTQRRLLDKLPRSRPHTLILDDPHSWSGEVAPGLTPQEGPDNAAYVIYTSGSTGRPKGAVNTHRGVCNRLIWMREVFPIGSDDVILQKTPISFDVSVWELFWPLLNGASLVLARPGGHRDPRYLRDVIIEQGVTLAHFVPSMLAVFLAEDGVERCISLRTIICSGEVLSVDVARRSLRTLPADLYNLYGPTEASIEVSSWACRPESIVARTRVPIGSPIFNTQLHVLDEEVNLVPVNTPGELHIAGDCLARGYLGHPGLTAARFVPNPFGAPGSRMYKTGDSARRGPDGTLEFLGRLDQQVKLRGHRIELGEIEVALRADQGVQDAVVTLHSDPLSDPRLVAYVVPAVEHEAAAGAVLQEMHLNHWQSIYDESYRQSRADAEANFDITGWRSSYTGEMLSVQEMKEQVAQTVDRVRRLNPTTVLEIGCGTGLLLFQLASVCQRYVATDFSASALVRLDQELRRRGLTNVETFRCRAESFESLPLDGLDCVVMNSVVQYFPSIDYLLQVLQNAVLRLPPGGSILIGDVRSLHLLEAYHTSVQLHHAADDLSTEGLRQRIRERVAAEDELLVSPDLFEALSDTLPRIGHIECQLRRGRFHNELTRFRYDVELIIGCKPSRSEVVTRTWQDLGSLERMRAFMADCGCDHIVVEHIPNARLCNVAEAMVQVADVATHTSVKALRAHLSGQRDCGIEPEDLWQLGEQLGFHAVITWDSTHVSSVRADFRRAARLELAKESCEARPDRSQQVRWSKYGNDPLRWRRWSTLVPDLRRRLAAELPEYMMPSQFQVLNRLPLMPNGKTDRRALPAPTATLPASFEPPRNETQQLLATLWQEVLGLDNIGLEDDFLELGGDSIRATMLVNRIGRRFGVRLPLGRVLKESTLSAMAHLLSDARGSA